MSAKQRGYVTNNQLSWCLPHAEWQSNWLAKVSRFGGQVSQNLCTFGGTAAAEIHVKTQLIGFGKIIAIMTNEKQSTKTLGFRLSLKKSGGSIDRLRT